MDQSTQLKDYLAVINLVANIMELIGIICGLYLVCHAALFEKFTLPIIDWRLNRIQQVLVGLMLIAIGLTTPFLWNLIPTGPEFDFSKDCDENKNQSPTPGSFKSKTTDIESYLRAVADKCRHCYFPILGYEIYPVSESFVLDKNGNASQITILKRPKYFKTGKTARAADLALLLAVKNAAPLAKPPVLLHTPIKLLLTIDGTDSNKPLRAVVNIVAQSVTQTTMDKTIVQGKESLFVLIDKLENSLPFRYQTIAKLIDRPFIPATEFTDPKDSNIHVRTSEDPTGPSTQVWIREPSKFTEKDKGNMVLDINTHMPLITIDEIIKRFGKASSIDAEATNGTPVDRSVVSCNYERAWGMLTFQFRKKSHSLLYVILNACENPLSCGGVVDPRLQNPK